MKRLYKYASGFALAGFALAGVANAQATHSSTVINQGRFIGHFFSGGTQANGSGLSPAL